MENKNIQRLMISAPQKSSGKTIVSLGILHNLLEQGKSVQSFKKGPDYIEPMWLKLASGDESVSYTHLRANETTEHLL